LNGIVLALGIIVGISLYHNTEKNDLVEEYTYTENNSDTEQIEKFTTSEDYGLSKQELPANLLSFSEELTSSRETQISLIHSPLIVGSLNEKNSDIQEENWNEEKIIPKCPLASFFYPANFKNSPPKKRPAASTIQVLYELCPLSRKNQLFSLYHFAAGLGKLHACLRGTSPRRRQYFFQLGKSELLRKHCRKFRQCSARYFVSMKGVAR
jgi:hypothetical protein